MREPPTPDVDMSSPVILPVIGYGAMVWELSGHLEIALSFAKGKATQLRIASAQLQSAEDAQHREADFLYVMENDLRDALLKWRTVNELTVETTVSIDIRVDPGLAGDQREYRVSFSATGIPREIEITVPPRSSSFPRWRPGSRTLMGSEDGNRSGEEVD